MEAQSKAKNNSLTTNGIMQGGNIKNILFVLAFPVVMGILMELVSVVYGNTHLLTSWLDIKNLIRSVGITSLVAYALSMNITSGRFDLSLGAQRIAAVVIGGNIALRLGLGGMGILIFSMIFGLFFGTIVGLGFITLRVPPMVLGIGMALIYECIAFASFNSGGLKIYGAQGVAILSDTSFVILAVSIVAALLLILFRYTTFGYHFRAAQASQKIAKESGVNIFLNAVICYAVAGVLISISGTFDSAFKGAMDAQLGLVSNAAVMSSFFPVFLGNYIGRRCNQQVGILVAVLTLRLFGLGLGAMNLSSSMDMLVNMIAFLAFLAFLANQNLFKKKKERAERIAVAKSRRAAIAKEVQVNI